MRDAVSRAWTRWPLALALVAGSLIATPPALASGQGEREYDRAQEAHQDERYEEAAAGFVAAYQAGYREETAAYNAACAFARARKTEQAFQWLEKAYDAGFDLEDYLDDDHDLRSLRGDPRFAALRAKVVGGRATRHEREGERAAQRFRGLLQDRSAKPEKYDDIGRELLETGRYDEAVKAFEISASRDDTPAASLYNAACARSLQGQKGAALDLLQRAVEQGFADPRHIDDDEDLDPIRNEPRFRQIRAMAAELEVPNYLTDRWQRTGKNLRKWQEAWPRIQAAVQKYPQLGQVWFNLGFAYISLGNGGQAVKPFERAVELGYHRASSMYNLACAHALAGHKDEAFAWLDKALAGGFDNWWLLRGDADLDDIRTDPRFRRYLELSRTHEREHQHDDDDD